MEVERPNRRVQVVATKIAHRAATECPKIPPGHGGVLLVAGHIRRGAQPQIPPDGLLIRGRPGGQALQPRVPPRSGYPGMRFLHFADSAVAEVFNRLPYAISAIDRKSTRLNSSH